MRVEMAAALIRYFTTPRFTGNCEDRFIIIESEFDKLRKHAEIPPVEAVL